MDISKQFEKACEAVERGNEDYAVRLFQEILTLCPDNLESRKKLHEALIQKYRKQGVKSAGAAAYVKGFVPLVKMYALALAKRYEPAMVETEKFLALDPNNVIALSNLGRAASGLPQCIPTAIWAYECVLEQKPTDAKTMATLGKLYESIDDVEKASEYYERLLKVKPDAREYDSKLRDLAARKTIKKGWDGVGQKGDFKKVVKQADQMEDRSGEEEIIRSKDDLERNIKRVEADIANEPGNKKYVIQLGDLFRRGKRFNEAKAQYLKAKELDANDSAIDERLGDLQIEGMDEQILNIKEAERKGTADASAKATRERLTAERNAFAKEEYKVRIKARPTDLPLRYKLGVLCFNAGEIDAALAEFQQAMKSPQHKRSATTYCGLCLYKKGMYDLSVQMFEDAMKDSVTIDRDDKQILYNLGLAAEKLGDLKKAEAAYKKLFNADINFLDVKEKIEALYKKRSGQAAS